MTAEDVIRLLALEPHPEGGWFRETYRAGESLSAGALPGRYDGNRAFATAIHFLLTAGSFSAFHRLASDEVFHYHLGDAATLTELHPGGACTRTELGPALESGAALQHVVQKHTWQALRVRDGGAWTLLGTTVAPGFEFADFEMARRDALLAEFPQHAETIRALARA